jgi:hypothetical protein
MDRGTKMMFGAMTVAISLMVINMFSNNASQAYAATLGAQGGSEPTIVWYGTVKIFENNQQQNRWELIRAWSDGLVEAKSMRSVGTECNSSSCDGWRVISDPNEGLAALSDLNDDAEVNVDDLLVMLDDWGPAPPNFIPLSDCPLAMINP